MSEFIKRTITGLILVILTIGLTLKGGRLLALFVFLISIIGLREFYNALDTKYSSIRSIGYIASILFFLNSLGYDKIALNFIMSFAIVSSLIFLVLKEDIKLTNISITIFSIFYIPFFISTYYIFRWEYLYLVNFYNCLGGH